MPLNPAQQLTIRQTVEDSAEYIRDAIKREQDKKQADPDYQQKLDFDIVAAILADVNQDQDTEVFPFTVAGTIVFNQLRVMKGNEGDPINKDAINAASPATKLSAKIQAAELDANYDITTDDVLLAEMFPTLSKEATQELRDAEIKEKIQELRDADILDSVVALRKILLHPFAQNRYIGIDAPRPGIISYPGDYEPRGILGLTNLYTAEQRQNPNNPRSPLIPGQEVTKADVTKFFEAEVKRALGITVETVEETNPKIVLYNALVTLAKNANIPQPENFVARIPEELRDLVRDNKIPITDTIFITSPLGLQSFMREMSQYIDVANLIRGGVISFQEYKKLSALEKKLVREYATDSKLRATHPGLKGYLITGTNAHKEQRNAEIEKIAKTIDWPHIFMSKQSKKSFVARIVNDFKQLNDEEQREEMFNFISEEKNNEFVMLAYQHIERPDLVALDIEYRDNIESITTMSVFEYAVMLKDIRQYDQFLRNSGLSRKILASEVNYKRYKEAKIPIYNNGYFSFRQELAQEMCKLTHLSKEKQACAQFLLAFYNAVITVMSDVDTISEKDLFNDEDFIKTLEEKYNFESKEQQTLLIQLVPKRLCERIEQASQRRIFSEREAQVEAILEGNKFDDDDRKILISFFNIQQFGPVPQKLINWVRPLENAAFANKREYLEVLFKHSITNTISLDSFTALLKDKILLDFLLENKVIRSLNQEQLIKIFTHILQPEVKQFLVDQPRDNPIASWNLFKQSRKGTTRWAEVIEDIKDALLYYAINDAPGSHRPLAQCEQNLIALYTNPETKAILETNTSTHFAVRGRPKTSEALERLELLSKNPGGVPPAELQKMIQTIDERLASKSTPPHRV